MKHTTLTGTALLIALLLAGIYILIGGWAVMLLGGVLYHEAGIGQPFGYWIGVGIFTVMRVIVGFVR